MKIALAQINPIIADIEGNTAKIIEYIAKAKMCKAQCVVFPELAVMGYPPMDLLEDTHLIDENLKAIETIAAHATDIMVICGFVDKDRALSPSICNAAAYMQNGTIVKVIRKALLPNYDVFDEQRYFSPGNSFECVQVDDVVTGITICEDIWNDKDTFVTGQYIEGRRYDCDPVRELVDRGAQMILNLSASPYVQGKNTIKYERISSLAKKYHLPVVYVNQVGGNDSLLFDGGSFVVGADGRLNAMAKKFEEDLLIVDMNSVSSTDFPNESIDDIESALVMGVKDYCRKCGFTRAVLGLSGGIDSAVTAAIAVKALGKENVMGVTMPSKYSSLGSVGDSQLLAANLGMRIDTIAIKGLFDQYIEDLAEIFTGKGSDVTEENLQARIRGTLLMAVSNKFGSILLTTGNKSELAMGYCTLYGDMNGGLAVISDLPKVMVYALANHLNRDGEVIPREIIEKAPSAELRENQKDQDSLPPYEILDGILELYIEKRLSREEIIAQGFLSTTVDFVLRTVDRNEYKRRQAAPGLKVTTKAFGIGRRVPMAMRLKH